MSTEEKERQHGSVNTDDYYFVYFKQSCNSKRCDKLFKYTCLSGSLFDDDFSNKKERESFVIACAIEYLDKAMQAKGWKKDKKESDEKTLIMTLDKGTTVTFNHFKVAKFEKE